MDEHVYVVFFAVFFADVFEDRFHIFKYGPVKNSSSVFANEDEVCMKVEDDVSSRTNFA